LSALGPLSTDMYLPATPRVTGDLHASQAMTQMTISACIAGLAIGQLIVGPLSDQLGRRRPLLIGIGAYVMLSLACAAAPTIGLLIAARLLQGLAGSAGLVISRAIVRDVYGGGRDAARAYALLMLVSGIAPAAAPVIGGQLLRITSWRGVLAMLALVGLVILLGSVTLGETCPPGRRQVQGLRSAGSVFLGLSRDRAFGGYTLAGAMSSAAIFVYISASPFVIEKTYGQSPQMFSLIFAVNSMGIILAGRISATAVRRWGPAPLLRAGLALQLTGAVGLFAASTISNVALIWLLVPLLFVVAAVGLVLPNATALALAPHGKIAGAASAQLGALQFIVGAALGPLAGVYGSGSALPMSAIMLTCSTAGVITSAVLIPRRQIPAT